MCTSLLRGLNVLLTAISPEEAAAPTPTTITQGQDLSNVAMMFRDESDHQIFGCGPILKASIVASGNVSSYLSVEGPQGGPIEGFNMDTGHAFGLVVFPWNISILESFAVELIPPQRFDYLQMLLPP